MKISSNQKIKRFLEIVAVIMALFLVTLLIVLVNSNKNFGRFNRFTLLHTSGPVTADDVVFIQTWMTFDYVNHIFNLPKEYLMTKLSVSNGSYPRLTIEKYAKTKGLKSSVVLLQVEDAVRAYFASKQ